MEVKLNKPIDLSKEDFLSVKNIKLEAGGYTYSPSSGRVWELLSGSIKHVNLTRSSVACRDQTGEQYFCSPSIAAATASGIYELDLAGNKVIIKEQDKILLNMGDATAYAYIRVRESPI